MRTLFTFLFAASFSLAQAQDAPDFTITDIDGNSHHLYETLDQGNVVVLKFFTNWCTICNSTASNVQALYDGYQTNGDPVVFWALDRDPNETNTHATTYRDNNSLTFPVIGEAFSVAQLYNVLYQPEYKIICPDRSYEEEITYSQIDQHVQTCLSQITGISTNTNGTGAFKVLTTNSGTFLRWDATPTQSATLNVYDVSGRAIVSHQVSGEETTSTENMAPGVYFYTLKTNGEVLHKGKFAVSK